MSASPMSGHNTKPELASPAHGADELATKHIPKHQSPRAEGSEAREDDDFTACHNVFDIPEHAEAIFLKLPMLDLLGSVLYTSRHWKSILDSSIRLQQHLFFKPISTPTLKYFRDPMNLREMDTVGECDITGRWATTEDERLAYTFYGHPILEWLKGNDGPVPEDNIKWEAMRRPEASWRRAFATQPPVPILTYGTMEWYASPLEHTFQNDAGVTLGDFDKGGLKLEAFDSEALDCEHQLPVYSDYSEMEAMLSKPCEPWAIPRYILLGHHEDRDWKALRDAGM